MLTKRNATHKRTTPWCGCWIMVVVLSFALYGHAAPGIGGIVKDAATDLKDATSGLKVVNNVDSLLKDVDRYLRNAQDAMFNGKYEESAGFLDNAAAALKKAKAEAPDNAKLKSLETKYEKQRKDLEQRKSKEAPASSSAAASESAASPAPAAAAGGQALPAGVTKRLKDHSKALDDALATLTKEGTASDEWKAKQAQSELNHADELMNEILQGYGDQVSSDHPELVAATNRRNEIQKQVDALVASVDGAKAAETADREAAQKAEDEKQAADAAEKVAWESREIDKGLAAKDWVAIEKHLTAYHGTYSEKGFIEGQYLVQNGSEGLAAWRTWKAEVVPFMERFRKTYGSNYTDVAKSFEGVQQPLDAQSDNVADTFNQLAALDPGEQEKRYLEALMEYGRDAYNRWKQMTDPPLEKMELKMSYTERALSGFSLAKELDPSGSYDDFIAQAKAAYDETAPKWREALNDLKWPGHNPAFAGPGTPQALAAAALEFLRKTERWSKPEYDDKHIPYAACVTGAGWEVSKTNALQQPTQYSIDITVAFEGTKDPAVVYTYSMVFYTREELGVEKGLPFMYCNSKLYQKYRMLKNKIPK